MDDVTHLSKKYVSRKYGLGYLFSGHVGQRKKI